MDVIAAALSGLVVVCGLLMITAGWRTPPNPRTGKESLVTRWQRSWGLLPKSRRLYLLVAVVAGVLTWLVTGWWLYLVLVPVAAIGLPWLLAAPPDHDVELLAALDRWISLISNSLPTGKSIRDAIRATRLQAPELLAPQIKLLLARLDDQWTLRDAFFAMAKSLGTPEADTVLAALMLAAERGGTGASATLRSLSENIQDHLHAAREIATERAKPRVVVRQVTMICVVVLGVAFIFGGEFFAPYRTPLGLAILIVLLACYAATLYMLRRMTKPKPRLRLLDAGVGHG